MKISSKNILISILVFSLFIRIVYAGTPYGWNEEVYIRGLRDFSDNINNNPSWLFNEEMDDLLLVGPTFYAVYLPAYVMSDSLRLAKDIFLHVISSILGTIGVYVCYLIAKRVSDEKMSFLR